MPDLMITCDRCERAFPVDEHAAGAKVACPYCGDINVVRVGEAPPNAMRVPAPGPVGSAAAGPAPANIPAPAPDRATALGLPPAGGAEQTVINVPGAMFRARPISATLTTLAFLFSAGSALYLGYQSITTWPLVLGGLAGVFFLMLAWWKIIAFSERLTITTKRVVLTKGIFSKRTVESLHRTIQEIEISQSFWQRILGIGKMSISNASDKGEEIVIPDAPDPYRLRQMIDAYRPM